MIFADAALPPLQSFLEAPSTVFCVAVVLWTVVINPSLIPKLSWITFAKGAKQFVVQDAFEIIDILGSYLSLLTPITNIGASFDGALIKTFLAPESKWACAFSKVVNTPEQSKTYSTPSAPQGILCGSNSLNTFIVFPFTTNLLFSALTSLLNLPCTVSNFIIYAI